MSDIVNTKSEKIREKYVHERSRAMTGRERRLNSRFSIRQTRTERLTLTDAARMNAKLKENERKKILDRQKKLENERQTREKDLHEKRRLIFACQKKQIPFLQGRGRQSGPKRHKA
mgnify:CR=1 FL=1